MGKHIINEIILDDCGNDTSKKIIFVFDKEFVGDKEDLNNFKLFKKLSEIYAEKENKNVKYEIDFVAKEEAVKRMGNRILTDGFIVGTGNSLDLLNWYLASHMHIFVKFKDNTLIETKKLISEYNNLKR